MLEIKLQIKDLDYNSLTELIIPKVMEKKAEKEDGGLLSSILKKTKGVATGATKAALGVMSQDMKEDLTASILMHYREDIVKALYQLAIENNVKVEIGDIEITKI